LVGATGVFFLGGRAAATGGAAAAEAEAADERPLRETAEGAPVPAAAVVVAFAATAARGAAAFFDVSFFVLVESLSALLPIDSFETEPRFEVVIVAAKREESERKLEGECAVFSRHNWLVFAFAFGVHAKKCLPSSFRARSPCRSRERVRTLRDRNVSEEEGAAPRA